MNQTAVSTFAGTIQPGSRNRPLGMTLRGAGTLVLSGSNNVLGDSVVVGQTPGDSVTLQVDGTLSAPEVDVLEAASLAGTGTIILTGTGGGLIVGSSTPIVFSGTLTGNAGLEVQSGAELTLAGDNDYNGGTTVSGGLLEIASAAGLPSGTSLTIGSVAGVVFDGVQVAAGQWPVASEEPASGATGSASASLSTAGQASSGTLLAAPLAASHQPLAAPWVAAVPEPGALALLAAGLTGLVLATWWHTMRGRIQHGSSSMRSRQGIA